MRWLLLGLAVVAGLFGATGVGLAAVGAHLSGSPNVTTAAYFLLFHAGALVALCAVAQDEAASHGTDRALLAASATIALGAALFSGDLALRALAGLKLVALAAPAGGVLMMLGWLVVAIALPLSLARRSAR